MLWRKEPPGIQRKEFLNSKFKKGKSGSLSSERKKQFYINIKYTLFILSLILLLLLACEPSKELALERAKEYQHEAIRDLIKKDYREIIRKLTKAIDEAAYAGGNSGELILRQCYERRASAYYNLTQYDNAISDYTKAIELGSELSVYSYRGRAFYAKGEYEKAISDFSTYIARYPEDSQKYFYRARSYESLGNKKQAIKDYKEAAKKGSYEAMDQLRSNGIAFESIHKRLWEANRGISSKKPRSSSTEISSKKPRSSSTESSCYSLGYRYGSCAGKVMAGLRCPPGDDFEMPVECRGKAETQRGIEAGLRSIMR